MYTTYASDTAIYMYIPFYGYYRERKYIIDIFATGNNCSMLTQDPHVADRHQRYDTVCVTALASINQPVRYE